ncbi:RnfABCDGE type electron transport complex subunit G [Tahibacter sp.]|uniref:RnfABCDGE type electron transport complex subunit G n=1 Tax=Tahibacter sp. TaxID=2056211 RepID=UPI0028C3DFD7|nr:RnfABCDGE type electron transport complex subunit G [Tahibacter sp.]
MTEARPGHRVLQLLLAAGLLVGAAWLSTDGLRRRADAQATAGIAGVLGSLVYDNDLLRDRIDVRDAAALGSADALPLWRARHQGQPVALVVDAIAPQGYGGPIRLRIGIARDGRVLGVRVIDHRETRGLGDAFEHDDGRWLGALSNRSLQDTPPARWRVRRDGGDFDQFSGATVTPRAILARVQAVLAAYAEHGPQWFDEEAEH